MKLTINKLIANDMINYGLDQATSKNYVMNLKTYLDDFDEEAKEYVLKNLDVINKDIEYSENIEDLSISGSGKNKRYIMSFNYGSMLNELERLIKFYADENNVEIDYYKIKDIAEEILHSSLLKDKIIDMINSNSKGYAI